jgi:hypothetical protein
MFCGSEMRPLRIQCVIFFEKRKTLGMPPDDVGHTYMEVTSTWYFLGLACSEEDDAWGLVLLDV